MVICAWDEAIGYHSHPWGLYRAFFCLFLSFVQGLGRYGKDLPTGVMINMKPVGLGVWLWQKDLWRSLFLFHALETGCQTFVVIRAHIKKADFGLALLNYPSVPSLLSYTLFLFWKIYYSLFVVFRQSVQ